MRLALSGEIVFWRGPSPHHFVAVPEAESAELQSISALVSYGWGMIPCHAVIGATEWTTSLFPKDGGYLVPIKDAVRASESLDVGDIVTIHLFVEA
jgi:hypothetical protein